MFLSHNPVSIPARNISIEDRVKTYSLSPFVNKQSSPSGFFLTALPLPFQILFLEDYVRFQSDCVVQIRRMRGTTVGLQ